ncbi:DUF1493 family protein [Tatumella sp. UCD-D_suzukii]|mgnify:FL=1|uniref:DUF1493 family protein n=1 Tax=Tatumella sp. UCD-D_suzukii TaxID=1408192 RepID=UPI000A7A1E95|nr:DUF1493 family protein [Tatumella sp. UCD-D_suzukii]
MDMIEKPDQNTSDEVISWYEENWNSPVFPFFRKPKLTPETSLSTGKYPWAWEDAEDILVEYFEKFKVERRNFSFIKYWPNEETFMPLNFLRKKENRFHYVEPQPLTIEMLVASAKAGYWIYD